jgi:hypothetical protein
MKNKVYILSLSDMAFDIANEPATKEDGTKLINNGKEITKAERILRQWAVSDNPVLQAKFMELALQKSVEVEKEEEKPKGLSVETVYFIRCCLQRGEEYNRLMELEPEKTKAFIQELMKRM